MAMFTTLSRKQLKEVLEFWERSVDEEETSLQLAFRVNSELKNAKTCHPLVIIRLAVAAGNIFASMKDPDDSTKLPLLEFDEPSLKQLALDLNIMPEYPLRNFIFNKTGAYYNDHDWDQLVSEIEGDPLDILRSDLKERLSGKLSGIQSMIKQLKPDP